MTSSTSRTRHRRWARTGATTLALLAATACQQGASEDPEEAYTAARERYYAAETAADKVAAAEDYLGRFPDTGHSGGFAAVIAYYRGEEMGDPEGASAFLEETLAKIDDPEARFAVEMELAGLAHELERPVDLGAIVGELEEHRPLDFDERIEVVEAATDYQAWAVAEQQASAALALATIEAYRADHPKSTLNDEGFEAAATRRRALALTYRGRALLGLDRGDEALALFAETAPLVTTSYAGAPATPLFRYWGEALLERGEPARALELLEADALFGGEAATLGELRRAYAATHGDESGFEEYVWAARQRRARTVDDFTLAAYDGQRVALSEIGKGKVVLLAFWFPT